MPKPPIQKSIHANSVTTSIRIPRPLHEALQEAALSQGWSLNVEILMRLGSPQIDAIRRQNDEIKDMLRMLLSRD